MASVTFEKATRRFPGSSRAAVADLDLAIADGEFLVLVGPSGCGKSTSLRMVAGLEEIDDGLIRIGDRDISTVAAKDRDIAMVFQNYALYPHMTVAQNMSFALRMARSPKSEINQRVAEAARILDLGELLDRKPSALSGGQRQRVAMGRAIVRNPQVFLMDEPLSNLDAQLRVQTRAEIATLQRRLGTTTIYVTHDQVEAMTMGDRVAVMFDGELQQVDTPGHLYATPANVTVARFIGSPSMNIREARIVEGEADFAGHRIPLPREVVAASTAGRAERVLVGFRPEALAVCSDAEDGFFVTVELVEELGADAYLFGSLSREENVANVAYVVARIEPHNVPKKGQRVKLTIRADQIHVFAADSGERLN